MASTSSKTPSLSSSSSSGSNYDVFLSFRGEDTRHSFTDHLHEALRLRGIEAFRDSEKLQLGQEIAPELIQAIKKSQFAIVVFSEKYADSPWCLNELAEIVECRKNEKLNVLPVFYHVDPSHVRNQTGPFENAFAEHQKNDSIDEQKIRKWKDAMREVGRLAGEHLIPHQRSEAKCIQDIVEVILNKLSNTVSAHTMGLIGIESQVDKLMSHLAIELNDVRIIGIWGTGGMGKTTLARFVYRMLSNKFEACCFIANVREQSKNGGLCKLQEILLKKLLMLKNLSVEDVDDPMIKNRLRNKKILLVLDDVTELDQLKKLAGKHSWFGSGSRVMITTRDQHLLVTHGVNEIYVAEALNHDEALKLFSLKAFKMDHPPEDYGKLSQAFVDYSKGLPLALEVLGSFLFNKSISEWKCELGRLRVEFCDRGILKVLQMSFDELQQNERDIFLYIACFFNHESRDNVIGMLDNLELHAEGGLRVLIDKSLIKLHENELWMHDLLQEMGRYIVCQESEDPGERSRLWSFKDIDNVLTENTGTKKIQGIVLELHELKKVDWNPEAFSTMRNLKLLKICGVQLMRDPKRLPNSLRFLYWRGYPSVSLTLIFQSKCFENLKSIDLTESQKLIEAPNITTVPNLEILNLQGCMNLPSIHPSIGIHKKLTTLYLRGCGNLTSLPSKFEMESLTCLCLFGCPKIKQIPEFGRNMKRLCFLDLSLTAITTVPTSIEHLIGLEVLHLRGCKNLVHLPSTIFNLKLITYIGLEGCINLPSIHPSIGIHKKLTTLNLRRCSNLTSLPSKFEMECLTELYLSGCSKLKQIPEFGRNMKHLRFLELSGTAITTVPTSIEHLTALEGLRLCDCNNLVHLPSIHPSIGIHKNLTVLYLRECRNLTSLPSKFEMEGLTCLCLSGCSKLKQIPEFGRNMKLLNSLELSGTAITTVPTSIEHLTGLKGLDLHDCKNLVHLPSTIFNLKLIKYINLSGCSKLDKLPENLENAESLQNLHLIETAIREVPSSIGRLKHLKCLTLGGCKGLSSSSSSPDPVDLLFSSLSLSVASSLTYVYLNDCNLKAISNDIGSLFSLEYLDLSGNDFVCLPQSIIRLSKLIEIKLNNCTSLRSLPKLPLNIRRVDAVGCISLEMSPDLLKPSDSLEPSLCLLHCSQLARNQSCIDRFISGIKKSLKLSLSPSLSVLNTSSYDAFEFNIVIPGSEIPEWFSHQRKGNKLKIKQPSHLYNEVVGIAICFVFCTHYDPPIEKKVIGCGLTANGKRKFFGGFSLIDNCASDHLWLVYMTSPFIIEELNKSLSEVDANGFSLIRIEIGSFYPSELEVKKCGYRMIYRKGTEDLNLTMVQSSVAVERHKVKRSRDDYIGAGPSGEGSPKDIPNPKRIKRHTETNGNSDSEELSEYKNYKSDEKLSDSEKSSESDG